MGLSSSAQLRRGDRHVLVVEDEPILAKNIMRFLSRRGFRVSVACCALDALTELTAQHIDIVVLDIDLPDGDGLDFYRRIFSDYAHLHLIVITGGHSPDDEARAYRLGARAFFRKPFTLAALTQAAGKPNTEVRSFDPTLHLPRVGGTRC